MGYAVYIQLERVYSAAYMQMEKAQSYLGALYVVVQVIAEGMDEIDGIVSGVGVGVAREQDCRRATEPFRPGNGNPDSPTPFKNWKP